MFRAISYSVAHRQVPKGEIYSLYCKYQLLKYKPWDMCQQKLQNVIQNVELETDSDHSNFEENKIQEEWMILSGFHNSSANFCDTITGFDNSLQYWQLQSDNYSNK